MSNADSAMRAALGAMVSQLADGRLRADLEAVLRGDKPEAPAPIRQEVVSAKEAATMLRVSSRTIGNFAAQGILQRVRAPGRRRSVGYTRESIERFLRGEKAGA